ncbi:MAG: quinone-dependent dihydroorotate dehydrogenase [Candidatus Saccharimonas sp.]
MSSLVRIITASTYQRVVKPLLFLRHPDKVHVDIVRVGRVIQTVPGLKHIPLLWQHQNIQLQQVIAGVTFTNPIGLAAGFDKNIELAPLLESVGFGFMTGGSVTAEACEGNVRPWFYRLPASKALVVNAGLPNQGIVAVVERLKRHKKKTLAQFPLSVSVAKTNSCETADDATAIGDYCTSLALLEAANVCQMYEVNISCPNTHGGEPFTTPARLEKLLTAVDRLQLTKPVFIKMPIDLPWGELSKLLTIITSHNVQGVTIGNLRKNRTNVALHEALPTTVKGGLSGAPTRNVSNELIKKTYQTYGDKLCIIGVGGVFSAEHAYEKIKAGASLVALITGMIFEGPQLIGDINSGLVQLMKADGYEHIAEAVGVDTLPQ